MIQNVTIPRSSRFNDEQDKLVKEASKIIGLNIGAFIRMSSIEKANQILQQQDKELSKQ